ncbi:hypothetical protein PCE1_003973 [Barthelona sp. PCE]
MERPLIIDNGGHTYRFGFAGEEKPLFSFQNITSRYSNRVTNEISQIYGVDTQFTDIYKSKYQTPFDNGLLTNFNAFERILDYSFLQLGTESIESPVIISESLLNPNDIRMQMLGVLFECYEVPKVALGVDCLFSHAFNSYLDLSKPFNDVKQVAKDRELIISIGDSFTHFVPYTAEKGYIMEDSTRLNVGGAHIMEYFMKSLSLHYPHVKGYDRFTKTYLEPLKHKFCHVALDFDKEMAKWSSLKYRMSNTKHVIFKMIKDEYRERRIPFATGGEPAFKAQAVEADQVDHYRDLYSRRSELVKEIETIKGNIGMSNKSSRLRTAIFAEHEAKTEQDEYGNEEGDWDVYFQMNKHYQHEELTALREDLDEVEEELQKDPNYVALERAKLKCIDVLPATEVDGSGWGFENDRTLVSLEFVPYEEAMHVSTEAFLACEVLFKPSMIGKSKMGVGEVLQSYQLNGFSINDVFMCGGVCKMNGINERINSEIVRNLPVGTDVNMRCADDVVLDSWRGMSQFGLDLMADPNSSYYFTREEYEECGMDNLLYHSHHFGWLNEI